jgi:hypothetical protein
MAKFTPGQVVSEVSGKLAGVVFSRSRSRAIVRVKKRGKIKAPIRKTISQGYFISLAKQWRTLTASQRTLWINFSKQNPTTDRFGKQRIRSGMHMFIYVNSFYILISQAVTTSPPLFQVVPRWNSFGCTITSSTLRLQFNPSPISGTWRMIAYCTRSMSQGISHPKESDYKFVQAINAGSVQNVNIRSNYEDVFGQGSLKVGSRVFVKAFLIRTTGSMISETMRTSAIVT